MPFAIHCVLGSLALGLSILGSLSGGYALAHNQVLLHMARAEECRSRLERIGPEAFRCVVEVAEKPPGKNLALIRGDSRKVTVGNCTFTLEASLRGYLGTIIQAPGTKRRHLMEGEATACLMRAFEIGELENLSISALVAEIE